jgi:competence protein ComEA
MRRGGANAPPRALDYSILRRNDMKMNLFTLVTSLALAVPLMAGLAGAVGIQDEALKVDLNRAGVEELMKLPGVGEKVAERIVAYREEHDGFKAPEELMNVRGIGEKTYLKIESYLMVSPESSKKK